MGKKTKCKDRLDSKHLVHYYSNKNQPLPCSGAMREMLTSQVSSPPFFLERPKLIIHELYNLYKVRWVPRHTILVCVYRQSVLIARCLAL